MLGIRIEKTIRIADRLTGTITLRFGPIPASTEINTIVNNVARVDAP